jgi:hypothetical protein
MQNDKTMLDITKVRQNFHPFLAKMMEMISTWNLADIFCIGACILGVAFI